jgi:hypothetical protein
MIIVMFSTYFEEMMVDKKNPFNFMHLCGLMSLHAGRLGHQSTASSS